MSSPVLELRGVTKAYGDHEVLAGIDLAVGEHEAVALIGASGSGKSANPSGASARIAWTRPAPSLATLASS